MTTQQVRVSNSGGVGFAGLLTIVFITLKLTGHIAWSWWWVLSPLWIGFAISLIFVAIALLFVGIIKAFER
jgi:hypothetical protein